MDPNYRPMVNMEKEIKKAQLRMMNIFIQELEDKLLERTSWGRNDLKDEIKNIKLEIIERALVE
jgi:REP element-mobilizing transposase RayT